MTWLVSPQEEELAAAAHAIAGLKPRLRTSLGLNLSQLVAHPSVQVRTLAAFLWAQDPQVPELGEALARDADRSVRVALATSLNLLEEQSPRVASMIKEVLLADLSAAVRFAAAHGYRPPSLSA
jgi:HEAT repeats